MGLCPKNQPSLQELEDVKDFYDPLGTLREWIEEI